MKKVLIVLTLSILLAGCTRGKTNLDKSSIGSISPTQIQGETVRNAHNGIYDIYDGDLIKASESKTIVLFFHSAINKESSSLDRDILENLKNLPQEMIIMKVDYDAQKDLSEKYKIKEVNEIIEINSKGEELKRIGKKNSLAEILKSL